MPNNEFENIRPFVSLGVPPTASWGPAQPDVSPGSTPRRMVCPNPIDSLPEPAPSPRTEAMPGQRIVVGAPPRPKKKKMGIRGWPPPFATQELQVCEIIVAPRGPRPWLWGLWKTRFPNSPGGPVTVPGPQPPGGRRSGAVAGPCPLWVFANHYHVFRPNRD